MHAHQKFLIIAWWASIYAQACGSILCQINQWLVYTIKVGKWCHQGHAWLNSHKRLTNLELQCGRLLRDSKIIYQSRVVGNPPNQRAQELALLIHCYISDTFSRLFRLVKCGSQILHHGIHVVCYKQCASDACISTQQGFSYVKEATAVIFHTRGFLTLFLTFGT